MMHHMIDGLIKHEIFCKRIKFSNYRKLDDQPLSALEPESAEFLDKYFEAADRGERNEDCAQLYAACNRSLHDFVSLSQNQIHSEKEKLFKN